MNTTVLRGMQAWNGKFLHRRWVGGRGVLGPFLASAVGLLSAVPAGPARAAESDPDLAVVRSFQALRTVPGVPQVATALSWAPLTVGVPIGLGLLPGASDPWLPAGVFVTEVAAAGSAEWIKTFVARPRPYVVAPDLVLSAGPESSTSMPSGHAALSFAAATLVARRHPDLAPAALGWATAVALSRVTLGVHYPTDVVAGALLGAGVGWLGGEALTALGAPVR